MFKNILTGLLLVLVAFLSVFVNDKRDAANQAKLEALENQVLALQNRERAKESEMWAVKAVAITKISERRIEDLEHQLKGCK